MTIRQQWLRDMEAAFGLDAARATIAATLDETRQAALEAGVGSNNTAKALAEALERFRGANFDDSLSAVRTLVKQDDALAALPQFGRGRRNAVEAATALATAAKAFLDAVDQNLTAYGQNHDAKHGALANSLSRINVSLQSIESDLIQMSASAGETANAA
jgi:hypothetical protein